MLHRCFANHFIWISRNICDREKKSYIQEEGKNMLIYKKNSSSVYTQINTTQHNMTQRNATQLSF